MGPEQGRALCGTGVMAGGLLQLQMLAQAGQEESALSMVTPISGSPLEITSQGHLSAVGAVDSRGDASSAAGGSQGQQMPGGMGAFAEFVSTDDEAGAAIEGVIQALLDDGMG